jgi:hypothetical protein
MVGVGGRGVKVLVGGMEVAVRVGGMDVSVEVGRMGVCVAVGRMAVDVGASAVRAADVSAEPVVEVASTSTCDKPHEVDNKIAAKHTKMDCIVRFLVFILSLSQE